MRGAEREAAPLSRNRRLETEKETSGGRRGFLPAPAKVHRSAGYMLLDSFRLLVWNHNGKDKRRKHNT